MKKLLALLLALLMCAFALVACAGDPEGDDEEGGGNDTHEVDPERGDAPEEVDYDGYNFHIKADSWEDYEIAAPTELNGQGINDQVYNRNKKVEKLYNITITADVNPELDTGEFTKFLDNMKMSGDYFADLYSMDVASMVAAWSGAGHFVNIYDSRLSNLDWDKAYWNQDFRDATTINGYAYCFTGDIQSNDEIGMIALMMNNSLYEQHFTDKSIYDIVVTEGTWTFETFFGMWQNFGQDNGAPTTGAIMSEDRVGYSYDSMTASYYMLSAGIKTFSMENGTPVLNINSDKALNVVDYLSTLVSSKPLDASPAGGEIKGVFRYDYDTCRSHFQSGNLLFVTNNMSDALGWYTIMEDEVNYLPFPKYDAEQEKYYTPVHFCFEPFAISANVLNLERTALITEALAYYSDLLNEEVCDLLIQERLTNEVKPRELLQTTIESQVYDMDYIAGVTGLKQKLTGMISSSNFGTYSSDVAQLVTKASNPRGTGTVQMFISNYTQQP